MKQITIILLCIVLMSLPMGCSSNRQKELEAKVAALQNEVEELKKTEPVPTTVETTKAPQPTTVKATQPTTVKTPELTVNSSLSKPKAQDAVSSSDEAREIVRNELKKQGLDPFGLRDLKSALNLSGVLYYAVHHDYSTNGLVLLFVEKATGTVIVNGILYNRLVNAFFRNTENSACSRL